MGRLALACTYYDHLAGSVGVGLRDGMLRIGLVRHDDGPTLTHRGRAVLTELGIEMTTTRTRPLLRECLDWTERREHLAGGPHRGAGGGPLAWVDCPQGRPVGPVTDAAAPAFSRVGLQLVPSQARASGHGGARVS